MLNGHEVQDVQVRGSSNGLGASSGLDHGQADEDQKLIDMILGRPDVVAEIVKADRKRKSKPKPHRPDAPKVPPLPLTKSHAFCPMIPAALILNRNLNGTEKNLFCWMLMWSKGKKVCNADQKTMREELGVSPDTIQRSLANLEDEGFVDPIAQDEYHLLVRAPGKAKTTDT